MRRYPLVILAALLVIGAAQFPAAPVVAAQNTPIGINVVLKTDITPVLLTDLGRFGTVLDTLEEIDAVHMRAREGDLAAIQALTYVGGVSPDAERTGSPVATVPVSDFANGLSTWDQDAINVTDFAVGRVVPQDGTGVYIAVLDTGLLDSWRQYFPEERIAEQYAKAFSGGGQDIGTVSDPTNMWQHDQNSHGTHVTSSILGYKFGARYLNGTAPLATIIPVKILNQAGWGWSSVIARGIVYVANLKATELGDAPVVISMSLGGPGLDVVEKAAIDYAISKGVVIVAAAGNEGNAGMGYPGAYAPVISVAASGWIGEWATANWWRTVDVAEADPSQFYIADFSSREKPGQQLDVAAPGSWVLGPYQVNSGQMSYYYLGGTSMATPHVSGIAALMLQKNPALTQAQVETLLKTSATYLAPGCADVINTGYVCWDADATGSGLTTADAALAAMDATAKRRR